MGSAVGIWRIAICVIVLILQGEAKRYFATESCGHVRGPDDLTVLEFDKYVNYNSRKPSADQDFDPPVELRGKEWTCIIVFRGMPSADVQKYIGIEWRSFHVRDQALNTVEDSVENCKKAYVTIYQGRDTTSAEKSYTTCGKDTAKIFYEWPGDYVTFKIYADFRRNASYTTMAPTTAQPTEPNCIDPDDVSDNVTTSLPVCTTHKNRKKETTTVPYDPYDDYPEVNFRVDITSFDYACNESIEEKVLKCNDSQRCLDDSLVCDIWFSHNCMTSSYPEDNTDQTKNAPSYCYRKETTTPVPTTTKKPPTPPFNWAPLAGSVGGVLGVLALCWCCWRPGYLPWRLARLRNAPCMSTQRCGVCRGPSKCCPCLACCSNYQELDEEYAATMVGRGGGPGKGMGGPGFAGAGYGGNVGVGFWNPSPLAKSSVFRQRYAPTRGLEVPEYPRRDPNNFATDWLKFISSDGAHLREQR